MPKELFSLFSPFTSIQDFDMLDSNAIEQRPTLSTSLSDFALFPSSSSAPSSPSAVSAIEEGVNPFFRRLRRSSLLAAGPINLHGDAKPHSPLAASFMPRSGRAHSIDSEKMNDDSSTSPETPSASSSSIFPEKTPTASATASETSPKQSRSLSTPSSPPHRPVPRANDDVATLFTLPPRHSRLLDIRSEINSPIEAELKSEAQFQRLVASWANSGLPMTKLFPRTPRSWSDRGRFPEEAGNDDVEDTNDSGSDDDNIAHGSVHSMSTTPSGTSVTPSGSGVEDHNLMPLDTTCGNGMDVDTPSSYSAISSPTQWRQTPPPTSRPGKRKFDDRYEPYPVSKRRAVSPALHGHHHHPLPHHSRSSSFSHPHPTLTIPIPIPLPRNGPGIRSVTSSPIMRPTSSPTMRAGSFGSSFGSPTIRPMARLPPLASLRGGSDTERERERKRKSIDGAGEAVSSLTLS